MKASGTKNRNRTCDHRDMSPKLCQLSYLGILLIRRVHSKSYHSGRALTQVIILQLPSITPEGVTLYICTLFGSSNGIRTRVAHVKGGCLRPLDYGAILNLFCFALILIIVVFRRIATYLISDTRIKEL